MPNFSFIGCLEIVVLWLEKQKRTKLKNRERKNSLELEASLAPAEDEVGAVAKGDQQDYPSRSCCCCCCCCSWHPHQVCQFASNQGNSSLKTLDFIPFQIPMVQKLLLYSFETGKIGNRQIIHMIKHLYFMACG